LRLAQAPDASAAWPSRRPGAEDAPGEGLADLNILRARWLLRADGVGSTWPFANDLQQAADARRTGRSPRRVAALAALGDELCRQRPSLRHGLSGNAARAWPRLHRGPNPAADRRGRSAARRPRGSWRSWAWPSRGVRSTAVRMPRTVHNEGKGRVSLACLNRGNRAARTISVRLNPGRRRPALAGPCIASRRGKSCFPAGPWSWRRHGNPPGTAVGPTRANAVRDNRRGHRPAAGACRYRAVPQGDLRARSGPIFATDQPLVQYPITREGTRLGNRRTRAFWKDLENIEP